jgi:hypothetical protein
MKTLLLLRTATLAAQLVLASGLVARADTNYFTLFANNITNINFPVAPTALVTWSGYSYSANNDQLMGQGPGYTQPIRLQFGMLQTGLTNIVYYGTAQHSITLQIVTPTTPCIISNYVPADALVIPASATGNVNIILQSSPDLLNWSAAEPGLYGPNAGTNRFFRVIGQVQ